MGNNKINNEISDDLLGKVTGGAKADQIECEGIVVEALPNAMFEVKIFNGNIITAHVSGKLRVHYLKIVSGDKVIVQLSPYNLSTGRIVNVDRKERVKK